MRNYVLLVMGEVWLTNDDINFDVRTYCAASLEEFDGLVAEYIKFLNINFPPDWHISKIYDNQFIEQSGGQKYYFEMDKPNIVALFGRSGSMFGGSVADFVFHSDEWLTVAVRESPRDSWSGGK